MRVRYTYSSRKTRRARDPVNIRKQKKKFPDIAKNVVEDSDIILEILDSRFIHETRNKDLEQAIKDKKKLIIYVFNKSDLVDTKKIDKELLKELTPRVFTTCRDRKGIKELRDKIKILAKKIVKPADDLGKIIVGVIGYPNTGKSSLINILIGRKIAGTGAEAGFTKGVQKIKLSEEIILLDSPGVIPDEKYSSEDKAKIASHTKLSARTYSRVKDPELVVASLMEEFPGIIEKYYKIKAKGNSEILLEELGKSKNLFSKGGEVDFDRTSRHILREWQEGKIKIDPQKSL